MRSVAAVVKKIVDLFIKFWILISKMMNARLRRAVIFMEGHRPMSFLFEFVAGNNDPRVHAQELDLREVVGLLHVSEYFKSEHCGGRLHPQELRR